MSAELAAYAAANAYAAAGIPVAPVGAGAGEPQENPEKEAFKHMEERVQITSSVSRVGILRSTSQVSRSFLEQTLFNIYTEIR